jgi:hypothetical protein
LSDIVSEIKCKNCGAALNIDPGEIVSTCRYCGYTAVVGADEPFQLEHSLILNNNNAASIENALRDWMREGFMKPGDLAKKSKILTLELRYLPFWMVPMDASSTYEGVLERISPPSPRKGVIDLDYDWLVLGRKGAQFPTRDYTVPDTGKIPFDFKRIDSGAKFLNSEITSEEAVQHARDEVEVNQRFLAKQEVDLRVQGPKLQRAIGWKLGSSSAGGYSADRFQDDLRLPEGRRSGTVCERSCLGDLGFDREGNLRYRADFGEVHSYVSRKWSITDNHE